MEIAVSHYAKCNILLWRVITTYRRATPRRYFLERLLISTNDNSMSRRSVRRCYANFRNSQPCLLRWQSLHDGDKPTSVGGCESATFYNFRNKRGASSFFSWCISTDMLYDQPCIPHILRRNTVRIFAPIASSLSLSRRGEDRSAFKNRAAHFYLNFGDHCVAANVPWMSFAWLRMHIEFTFWLVARRYVTQWNENQETATVGWSLSYASFPTSSYQRPRSPLCRARLHWAQQRGSRKKKPPRGYAQCNVEIGKLVPKHRDRKLRARVITRHPYV